ncbi:phosphoglycerate kinase, partial [Candidatus Daviesbacteria bacterium]|nr:phosphoglycerate kinase [Candidatus Daviesbacteria bacterium]
MQVINAQDISGKKVLLRYDIDVVLEEVKDQSSNVKTKVVEDFKLEAGIPTLNLCLQNASQVILMGHIGRPEGKVDDSLKVAPIVDWFINKGYEADLDSQKLVILENLRFDSREQAADLEYAKELASKGDFYVNEA